MSDHSPYLTMKEAGLYSRIPRRELARLLETGEIHSRRVGRKIIVAKAALDAFLTAPDPEVARVLSRR